MVEALWGFKEEMAALGGFQKVSRCFVFSLSISMFGAWNFQFPKDMLV